MDKSWNRNNFPLNWIWSLKRKSKVDMQAFSNYECAEIFCLIYSTALIVWKMLAYWHEFLALTCGPFKQVYINKIISKSSLHMKSVSDCMSCSQACVAHICKSCCLLQEFAIFCYIICVKEIPTHLKITVMSKYEKLIVMFQVLCWYTSIFKW